MLTRIALFSVLLSCSTALADDVPALPLECASPEVARANANLVRAEGVLFACFDVDECAMAKRLVAASVEQKRAAVASTCMPEPKSIADNFADPWDSADDSLFDGAWCAVMGSCGTPAWLAGKDR
jgi:hypothetical protein